MNNMYVGIRVSSVKSTQAMRISPFVLNFPIKTVRIKTVPHALQGVLTSRTAVKIINLNGCTLLFQFKWHKKDIRLFTHLYKKYH